MTETLETLRSRLLERVRNAAAARKAVVKVDECQHQWQEFKQTLVTDNPNFNGEAYFRVNGCPLCKRKEILELVVQG